MGNPTVPQPRLGDSLFFHYPQGVINRPPGIVRHATVASIVGSQMALWVLDPDFGNQYFRVDVRDYGEDEGKWSWPDKA